MIDYDKLKKAHELILKADEKYGLAFYIGGSFLTYHRLYAIGDDYYEDFGSIDELIEKLESLVKPESKYKVGDKVFTLNKANEPIEFRIIEFYVTGICPEYFVYRAPDGERYSEQEVFLTREDLIESQINHWTSLKKQQISTCSDDVSMKCQHEHSFLSGFRCIKCDQNCMSIGEEWLKRITEYHVDKRLAEKCGLEVNEICAHEPDFTYQDDGYKCIKCREFY